MSAIPEMLIKLNALLLAISLTNGLPGNLTFPRSKHPDVGLNIKQMIERQGYPVETHPDVKTSDGYLLDIYRIPYGKDNSSDVKRPVVFLMHGLLCSAADWIIMGPDKALAYLLADAGYDVWMGNARGTTWSRKHIYYDPDDDKEFWNFSWHEIGTRDLPAMIDYILEVTGEENLFYVGHSQGTTAFFVMTSEEPQYNDKIRLMSALAPVAYTANMVFPLTTPVSGIIKILKNFFGVHEFLGHDAILPTFGQSICQQERSILQSLCSNLLFVICGWDSKQLNKTIVPVIFSNTPAGASIKQVLHYFQEVDSDRFCQYDYGSKKANFAHYRLTSPPDYNIGNVKAPVALYYSRNDRLSAVVDVERLANELPNVSLRYLVSDAMFNHLDFLFGNNAKELIYDRLMELMQKY